MKKSSTKDEKSPLQEAWLSIRWQLEKSSQNPAFQKDVTFPIALGMFAEGVKDRFSSAVPTKENDAPLELLPFIPRYQFRTGGINGWPLVQLGPGVSTLNYTENYDWKSFLDNALFLRKKLIKAYESTKLKPEAISLRYRNAILFDEKEDLFALLKDKLNYHVQLPIGIPSDDATTTPVQDINFSTVFKLETPKAQGILRVATGYKKEKDNKGIEKEIKHIVFDNEIVSNNNECPDYYDEDAFKKWLDNSHGVAKKWFSSLAEHDK